MLQEPHYYTWHRSALFKQILTPTHNRKHTHTVEQSCYMWLIIATQYPGNYKKFAELGIYFWLAVKVILGHHNRQAKRAS